MPSLLTIFSLICGGLPQKSEAVSPPPDGGYPGFNTAEGTNALKDLTTGVANTAVGWFSLLSNTDGSFNTGVGAGTLVLNVGNQSTGEGVSNTAVGAAALLLNMSGSNNTAVGTGALVNNDADENAASGAFALNSNTTGALNTANGAFALFSNTSGSNNTACGGSALSSNTEGNWNSACGWGALASNTTGNANTATGFEALRDNVTGINNTAIGFSALLQNIANFDTAVGESALAANSTGSDNTAIGNAALVSNTTGSDNTAIGGSALNFNISGNANVAIGAFAAGSVITADNVICIGAAVSGNNISNTCFIGNIRGVATNNANAIPVLIDSAGQLGTASSSARFKRDIKCMNNASESILALKPVTFHYKSDTTDTPQFGLIAEEVTKVNPDLVVRDENGEIYTVRYDAVNAMLLNEFLKEHRKVEEQAREIQQQRKDFETTITELRKEVEAVVAHSKQQDAKIQMVSAQIKLSRSGTKLAEESQ